MNYNTIPLNWAAFWLFSSEHALSTDRIPNSNKWCELDIFEAFENSIFVGTVHHWLKFNNGTTINSQNSNNWYPVNNVDFSDWHTYGVLWNQSQITWYLDTRCLYVMGLGACLECTHWERHYHQWQ